eukprot:1145188-Pelagomonas_calceolata.AAC.1
MVCTWDCLLQRQSESGGWPVNTSKNRMSRRPKNGILAVLNGEDRRFKWTTSRPSHAKIVVSCMSGSSRSD